MKKQVIYALIFAALIISIVLVFAGRFDFNNDGSTNIADLQSLASHYQGKAAYNSTFDLNNNGKIDLFDLVAEAKNVNTSSGAPGNSSGAPMPPAVGSTNLLYDTRAGGTQDIQASTVLTMDDAKNAMWPLHNISRNAPYYVYPLDFITNLNGNGIHAYRLNWRYLGGYNGTAASCYNGNGEHDQYIEYQPSIVSQPLYIQWKVWRGRTATGGGWGNSTIGSFINASKLLIMFRYDPGAGGSISDGRLYFGYNGVGSGMAGGIAGGDYAGWTQGRGTLSGTIHGYLNTTPIDLNDYNNQVVTFTLYFKPESSTDAYDGIYTAWIDNVLLWNLTGMRTTPHGYGWTQLGGPTWICPPQDQTQYMWDFVEWTPNS